MPPAGGEESSHGTGHTTSQDPLIDAPLHGHNNYSYNNYSACKIQYSGGVFNDQSTGIFVSLYNNYLSKSVLGL